MNVYYVELKGTAPSAVSCGVEVAANCYEEAKAKAKAACMEEDAEWKAYDCDFDKINNIEVSSVEFLQQLRCLVEQEDGSNVRLVEPM